MNNMDTKETIDATPAPEDNTSAPDNAYSLSLGLTVSKYPYSLINRNFPTSSISTKKTKKEKYTNNYKDTFYYAPESDAFSYIYL